MRAWENNFQISQNKILPLFSQFIPVKLEI